MHPYSAISKTMNTVIFAAVFCLSLPGMVYAGFDMNKLNQFVDLFQLGSEAESGKYFYTGEGDLYRFLSSVETLKKVNDAQLDTDITKESTISQDAKKWLYKAAKVLKRDVFYLKLVRGKRHGIVEYDGFHIDRQLAYINMNSENIFFLPASQYLIVIQINQIFLLVYPKQDTNIEVSALLTLLKDSVSWEDLEQDHLADTSSVINAKIGSSGANRDALSKSISWSFYREYGDIEEKFVCHRQEEKVTSGTSAPINSWYQTDDKTTEFVPCRGIGEALTYLKENMMWKHYTSKEELDELNTIYNDPLERFWVDLLEIQRILQDNAPDLLCEIVEVYTILHDQPEILPQEDILSKVAEIYQLYTQFLENHGGNLSEMAGVGTKMEDVITRFFKHPVIILHRYNLEYWSDIINMLVQLDEIKRNNQQMSMQADTTTAMSDQASSQHVVPVFYSQLLFLEKLLQSDLSDKMAELDELKKLLAKNLGDLRKQFFFVAPSFSPPILSPLVSLLKKHKDKIIALERPKYFTWHISSILIHEIFRENKSYRAKTVSNQSLRDEYNKSIEKGEEFFKSLPVSEQIKITKGITGDRFFNDVYEEMTNCESLWQDSVVSRDQQKIAGKNAKTKQNRDSIVTKFKRLLFSNQSKDIRPGSSSAHAVVPSSVLDKQLSLTPGHMATKVECHVCEYGSKQQLEIVSGEHRWEIVPSQILSVLINTHSMSLVEYIKQTPASRNQWRAGAVSELNQQLDLNRTGWGYLPQSGALKNLYQQALECSSEASIRKIEGNSQAGPVKVKQPLEKRQQLALPAAIARVVNIQEEHEKPTLHENYFAGSSLKKAQYKK